MPQLSPEVCPVATMVDRDHTNSVSRKHVVPWLELFSWRMRIDEFGNVQEQCMAWPKEVFFEFGG